MTTMSQLAAISPQGKLRRTSRARFRSSRIDECIIPSTESLWLEKDIPSQDLREALITPAFSHVDPDKHATWKDQWHLVEFLAGVLREAD